MPFLVLVHLSLTCALSSSCLFFFEKNNNQQPNRTEQQNVDQNNKLGEFLISGVERAKAGEPKVEVTFALDANGILNVSARDVVS